MYDAHEGPVIISLSGVIKSARNGEMTNDVVGTDQIDAEITTTTMTKIDNNSRVEAHVRTRIRYKRLLSC